MIRGGKGTSVETALKGRDVEETAFRKNLSSLTMVFAAVIVTVRHDLAANRWGFPRHCKLWNFTAEFQIS